MRVVRVPKYGREEFAIVSSRARRVIDGALIQKALPGHDGVPVGLS